MIYIIMNFSSKYIVLKEIKLYILTKGGGTYYHGAYNEVMRLTT